MEKRIEIKARSALKTTSDKADTWVKGCLDDTTERVVLIKMPAYVRNKIKIRCAQEQVTMKEAITQALIDRFCNDEP